MCGIAAVFAYGKGAPPVDRDEVLRMRDQMFSRGPDGEGDWFSSDGRVGLGHRRLSIIDLSPTGAQPMFSADGSLVIIFNGEIYNYRELRATLEQRGRQFHSQSDTEVLLHLYAEHGDAMLKDVRGMYAFAIWDHTKEGIFIVRDPFGIKPLYYANNGHTFRLASQVKALQAGGKVDLTAEPAGHVGYFLWGHVPDPYTMYRGIRSLPAGHTMWVDRNGARPPRKFCDIAAILREAEEPNPQSRHQPSTINDQPSDLRAALAETVRYHLVADVPVGVFLSSGLDSTTIAALAAEQGGILRTVTLGFEEYKGTEADEVPLAEQFAAQCGAAHQTIWVSRADFESEKEHLFAAMDRPSVDGVNTFFVSLAARRANLTVALSGLGGDELFASYSSFRDIPRTVRFLQAFRHWRSFGATVRVLSAPILKRLTSPKYAGLFEFGSTYSGAYLLRRGMFMPWELPELLDPEMVRSGWQELQTLLRLEETIDGINNPRVKVSALEMNWYMRHRLLRDSDWAGMGHSVEIRVPFVDVDLLRALAPLLASKNPPSKQDMARTPSIELPGSILNRRKTGFQIPVRDWLLQGEQSAKGREQRAERGLRGWAVYVYRRFPGSQKLEVRGQKSSVKNQQSAISNPHFPEGQRAKGGEQSSTQSEFINQQSAISNQQSSKRILIFRIGQLGDTIVSLPAMWAVRRNFPDVHLALLCDRHPGKSYVLGSDLLRGAGIFDEFLSYPVTETGALARLGRMVALLNAIRRRKFDTLVYLAPSARRPEQVERDRRFFSLAGIKRFIGMDGFADLPRKMPGQPLAATSPESDLLLNRLAASGLHISPGDRQERNLGLGTAEDEHVTTWLRQLDSDRNCPWVAVGPGSKMPAKRWPLERFQKVIADLIQEFDVWPVVFGGDEDEWLGENLLEAWGRGYNAAGALRLRPAAAALKRCTLFLGNDTGTMHLAAAVGVRCVALFSSRERPGMWFPIGEGHRIFRTQIECEGCGLVECIELQNECLKRISAAEVFTACRQLLDQKCTEAHTRVEATTAI